MKATAFCAALLLLAATAVPALWTMKCYTMGRMVHMWGQAEDCMPDRPVTDGAAVNVLCCEFSGVTARVDELQVCPTTDPPEPVLIAVLHTDEPTAFATRSVRGWHGVAHGPPPLAALVDLTAIGRLRI